MTPIRLNVAFIRQNEDGQCLPACAAMVLDFLGIQTSYERLLSLLRTGPAGTPAFFIRNLNALGINVLYKQGSFEELYEHLTAKRPCIAFVSTGQLPYWSYASNHAVVVVGLDDENVYVNDPAVFTAPIAVSRGDFDLAWLERDEYYATFLPRGE